MNKPLRLILLVLLTASSHLHAQDIEGIIKAPPLTASGGLMFSQIGSFSPDSGVVTQPYSYYLSGNLNTSFFGVVNVPISFAYTNNQLSSELSQPFNRFSIAPSYKWIKAYMGYASMSFSSYTLSGHEFMGGGVELSPGDHFRFQALYGRFMKTVNPDTLGSEPAYYRLGGGFKAEYLNKYVDVGINLFKAKDDQNSISFTEVDSMSVTPKDNLTGGVNLKIKLIKNMVLTGEYGISAYNDDISVKDSSAPSTGGKLITDNSNLVIYHAYRASIAQSTKIGSIGASYEHVDPNYKTLGAYYFANDFENITADFSTSIKQRINIAMNVGYQHDDLENQNTNSTTRMIYSINTSAKITKRLTLGGSLSNIQSYIHIRDIYDEVTQTNQYENLDTLSYTQISQTESVNANILLQSSKEKRQNLNANFTHQKASQIQEDQTSYTGSQIYNSTLSYQFSLIPQRLNTSLSVNHNYNLTPETEMQVMSYNLSVSKMFWGALKTAFVGTYSNSTNNEGKIADIINLRITTGYTYQKHHTLNLSMAMVQNKGVEKSKTQFNVNLTYNYIFNFMVKRDKTKLGFEGSF